MQFGPPRARECINECGCKGGLHAPQSDLDSLSSPVISVSCRAGNTETNGAVALHTDTNTQNTFQVHVEWTTPPDFSLSSPSFS